MNSPDVRISSSDSRGDDLAAERRQLVERALHRRVFDRVELDRAQCGVIRVDRGCGPRVECRSRRRSDRRSDTSPQRIVGRAGGAVTRSLREARGSPRCERRRPSPTTPCAATSAALLLEIRPSAIAAQARISESSRRPRKPLPLSTVSRYSTPSSPASVPNASKNAIFSVGSASRIAFPFTAASIRGSTSL